MNEVNQTFYFKDYRFDPASKQLDLHYGYDGLDFTETYRFDFETVDYDPAALDRAVQLLFFIAGVSYYKVYAPPHIKVQSGAIDAPLAAFLSQTYQKGLGEFFYVNQLDPRRVINFPINSPDLAAIDMPPGNGAVVGIGGGKDSLVSVELLRGKVDNLATWSVNHRPQLTALVERIGLQHFWVERTWDPQLQTLNKQPGTYNGHVPISALFAAVGNIVAVLTGRQYSIVSNEQSANEPTLKYQGLDINHQYSKSQEFEQAFQQQLQRSFGDELSYFSFLRPLSELHIAEIFAAKGFQKYHDVFSSCNRAYVHGSDRLFWDGQCAKCAFVFLALTPFVERQELETLFHGQNLLLNPSLDDTYRRLLGIAGDKPLDCVGEIKESRAAMRLAQQTYPQLRHFEFDIPESYDYRAYFAHEMPQEYDTILRAVLQLPAS